MLEPPRRGGSNEYLQSMFEAKIRKIGIPQFCYIKVGFKGVYMSRTCFPDVYWWWHAQNMIFVYKFLSMSFLIYVCDRS